jgi:hypothetical protein
MGDMKYKINYISATLNFQKTSMEGFLYSTQKAKNFDGQYCVVFLKEEQIILKNVHGDGTQTVIPFSRVQFITTGEKIFADPTKSRWALRPKTAEVAGLIFYLQLEGLETDPYFNLKSFQQLVDANSDRILVLRASSYVERQLWVEIIGSIIYL